MRGSGGGEMLEMLSESSKGSEPQLNNQTATLKLMSYMGRTSEVLKYRVYTGSRALVLLKNSLRGSSVKQGWRMIAAGLGNQRN